MTVGRRSDMTPRERHIETLTFGAPDRVPFTPGNPRESTLRRWCAEGLPAERNWFEVLCETIGIERDDAGPTTQPGVSFRMIPQYEEKVLEHRNGHYVVLDWMGNVTEISDEYDFTYIREAKDFVTRKWHKFPVETRADFEEMKKRYDPAGPGRYGEDFEERVRRMKGRDWVVRIFFAGPFWQMREWCGFEPLCMMFIEDPDFVREMAAFWTDFISTTLERLLDAGVVDHVVINEDMAYKEKAMISPSMTREFIMPSWVRWTREAKEAGVPIIELDCDGMVDELIGLWIESDINVSSPMEVAAGNDINLYRACFAKKIAFIGGVDKRSIAKGPETIENELARIAPVVRGGGYIPGCDHGVPPDVSWQDFKHYARLLAELTGWL